MRNMNFSQLPTACVTDLVLDRLSAGELSSERVLVIERHLTTCRVCQARRESLDALARAFSLDARSERTLAAIRAARPPRRRHVKEWTAAVLSVAAALAFFLLPAREDRDGPRSKGSARFGFYVKRGELVFRGVEGEQVQPGDQLRLTVRLAQLGYVAVLSLDSRGVANVYYPAAGAPQQIRPQRDETALAASVELDDTLGDERLYAFVCDVAVPVLALRSSLAQHHTVAAPDGCQLEVLRLIKVPVAR